MKILFVGEKPSDRAIKMGVEWKDGHLAAKQLFDALRANGVDPHDHSYTNWFVHAKPEHHVNTWQRRGYTVVAMGEKVSAAMVRSGITHLKMVHPAARGLIRRKDRYAAHVASVLGQARTPE